MLQLSRYQNEFKNEIFLNESEPFKELIPEHKFEETLTLLEHRLNERNIIIISKVFSSITLKRASEILQISISDAEDMLVDMIADDKIVGLINRLGEINIVFKRADNLSNLETLNKWGNDLHELLTLLESTSYLIRNEEMVQAAN